MLITAAVAAPACFAQNSAAARKFSIGYLPEGSDIPNAAARMEELRNFLWSRAEYRQALVAAGYAAIELSPCDGPRDMVQRMNAGEFDLIFATAMVYAQQAGEAYEPILQLKQPTDYVPPGQDSGVLRQGVIFVGPRSALFHTKTDPTPEDLRRLLEKTPLAVPSADSAVGYLAPRYIMTHDLGIKTFPSPLFCGSDSEVVKHVVSGLAEVGACSKGALTELLPGGADASRYYRILRLTYPLPTDPLLLRRELAPGRSPLGRSLKQALREGFFSNSVANASARDFEKIVKYLLELNEGRSADTQATQAQAADRATSSPGATTAPTLPAPAETGASVPEPTPTALPTASPTPAPGAGGKPTPPPRPALPTPVIQESTLAPRPELPPTAKPQRPRAETSFAAAPEKPQKRPTAERQEDAHPTPPASPPALSGPPRPVLPAASPTPLPRPQGPRPTPALPPAKGNAQ